MLPEVAGLSPCKESTRGLRTSSPNPTPETLTTRHLLPRSVPGLELEAACVTNCRLGGRCPLGRKGSLGEPGWFYMSLVWGGYRLGPSTGAVNLPGPAQIIAPELLVPKPQLAGPPCPSLQPLNIPTLSLLHVAWSLLPGLDRRPEGLGAVLLPRRLQTTFRVTLSWTPSAEAAGPGPLHSKARGPSQGSDFWGTTCPGLNTAPPPSLLRGVWIHPAFEFCAGFWPYL